ncbi:hypothetical protein NKR19_g3322 [Coniochaeta hoffmannii]|uniref:Uncharacterized protein n=1 Tax=Coniochaeta hoffmannii TaxID=91930 RepID=A0AA38VM72_9PEZI|nr:hypothetical protein NKR19_g3322 [Coniochaeta hoffmannii]
MLLVDYDVSSGWANWQYVSGVGNDFRGDNRIFNLSSRRSTTTRRAQAEYRPRSSNRKRGAVPREAANDGENVAHAQNQASLKPSSQLGSGTAPRFLMVQAYISLPSETAAYSVATGSGASSPWRALAGK